MEKLKLNNKELLINRTHNYVENIGKLIKKNLLTWNDENKLVFGIYKKKSQSKIMNILECI